MENSKTQYFPVVVHRNGSSSAAKLYSNHAKRLTDRYCWDLDEAKDCIKQAIAAFSKGSKSTYKAGSIGISDEGCPDSLEIVDSYIEAREVTEWKRL